MEESDDADNDSCMGGCYPLVEESEDEDEIGHDVNCSGCYSGNVRNG